MADDPQTAGPLLLLAAAGREQHLLEELQRTLPGSAPRVLAPGLLSAEPPPELEPFGAQPLALAFAAQVLPDARPLAATSVARWAELCAGRLIEALGARPDPSAPWRLHVLAEAAAGSRLGAGRAALVRQQLLAALTERRRALRRALVEDETRPWGADDALAQVLLTDLDAGWWSLCLPPRRRALAAVLSRFPGGAVDVPEDKGPPSRAWRKLAEAELHLGRAIAPGERCVDLGASPGGWSAVALARGAAVLAVDRAPLRADLMAHARLQFHRGDAFRFPPPAGPPCDWLLCDVIAFPARTLELLERWLASGACRRYVVTLKFRGAEDYPRLQDAKALLARHGGDFLLRQLGSNRNEVTALGTRP
jgi:23S rRNA (cytidine2498-2'-O)-methyltransferase